MAVTHLATDTPAVAVEDHAVVIHDLTETDTDLVSVVSDADDAEDAVRRCLQIGARASVLVRTTVDTQLVERSFDGMTKQLGATVDRVATELTAAADGLVGEDGVLVAALATWQADVTEFVEANFDDDSKASITSKIEQLVSNLLASQHEAFKKLVDPASADGPLTKLQTHIDDVICKEVRGVHSAVIDLAERVAAKRAAEEAFEHSAIKGFTFEDLVHGVVSVIADAHGDCAEKCGRQQGVAGGLAGDEVVLLNEGDTFGAAEAYVLEVKDKKLTLAQTQAELDDAIANRGARAAIAVFSSQVKAPTAVPFSYRGNKAIVVLDKDDPDPRDLRLACMWARWIVRRQLSEHSDDVDVETIEALVDEAVTATARIKKIKGHHTSAKRTIDLATAMVVDMGADLDEILERLRRELDR